MTTLTRLSAALAAVLLLACMLACGAAGKVREAADRVKTQNDLRQLAMSYLNVINLKQRGPANTQEWAAAEADPQVKALINETGPGGRFTFFWNVRITNLPSGASNTVLGYENKVTGGTGAVVMADGVVMQMTAAEFQAKPKPPPPYDDKK